jgi:GAF domain-containing protein
MQQSQIQPDEGERLQDLYAIDLLDTPHEERFDRFIHLAKDAFHVPIVLISLVDAKRVWFKASYGLSESETTRDSSLCAYTILTDKPLIIPNTLEHPRFANHPIVIDDPFVRFYAGCSLHGLKGKRIGSFCLIDVVPRELNDEDLEIFHTMALAIEHEMQSTVGEAISE